MLTLVGAIFFLFGLAAFTYTPINRKFYLYFTSVVILCMLITTIASNQLYRSLLNGTVTLFISLQYIRIIWINRDMDTLLAKPLRFLLAIYILFSISFLYRIILDLISLSHGYTLTEFDSTAIRMSNLLALVFLSGVNFIIIMLSNNKLLSEIIIESSEKTVMLEKLKLEVEHDGLTRVLNRSGLDSVLEKVLYKQKKEDRYMLILLDIDNFKEINDSYGHETGDRVLIQLAHILTQLVRSYDYVGRWGGDEFLILARSSLNSEFSLPDRLLTGVQNFDWKTHISLDSPQVSISLGFTRYHLGESKLAVLRRCDKNLYRAKEEGKNRAIGDTY